jgi:NADH:ubiquinone oxidoreductase subunit 6 (subunit J)
VAVVVTQNIVRAATWLLFALAGTSGIFFLLGADLVGAIQLLVYVGGTLVLLVFGVMLTAQGPFITMKTGTAEWAISLVVGLLLLSVLGVSIFTAPKPFGPPAGTALARFAPKKPLAEVVRAKSLEREGWRERDEVANAPYSAMLGQGLLGVGVGPAHHEGGGKTGRVVRMNYLLPFEIVSVHLLVVLIGAAYLARAKRRREADT